MIIKPLLVAILNAMLMLVCAPSLAQQSVQFTRYDVADGLVSMTCGILGQDSTGFLWLGAGPLMRFDGYEFKTFPSDPADPYNNPVFATCMADDGRGHLLFAGHSELWWFNPTSGFMEAIRNNGRPIQSPGFIELGKDSEFWCVSDGQLLKIRMPEQIIEKFPLPPYFTGMASYAAYTQSGLLWLSMTTGWSYFDTRLLEFGIDFSEQFGIMKPSGIFYYKAENGKLFGRTEYKLFELNENIKAPNLLLDIELSEIRGRLLHDSYETIICSRDGKYAWIHGAQKNIFRIEIATSIIKEYEYSDLVPASVPNPTSTSISELSDGRICFGANSVGILFFNPVSGIFELLEPDKGYSIPLTDDRSVHVIFQSDNNVLWIYSTPNGLVKAEFIKPILSAYCQVNNADNQMNNPNVRCIEELNDQYLFYSTFDDVSLFDRRSNTFSPLLRPEGNSSFSIANGIKSMVKDKLNNLFVGGWDGAIFYLDYMNRRTIQIRETPVENPVYTAFGVLFLDSKENLWYGDGKGMTLINTKNFVDANFDVTKIQYIKGPGANDLVETNMSTGIAEDVDGRIWIGRRDGLYLYDYATDQYTKQSLDEKKPRLGVISIFRSSDNSMWIGTDGGGLKFWDKERKIFITYSVGEGLPDNVIYSIEEDGNGNLWMGTNKGLCRFSPKTLQCKTFTEMDGIQNYEYNGNSSGKTSDGWLAFGGVSGFNFFHPDSVNRSESAPRLVFTDFKVHGENRPYLQDEIFLNYNENNFSIEFAALDFFRNQEHQYAYKMENLDNDWIMCGDRRFVSYPALEPGTYTFRVKACNSFGVWNETGISKTIIIAAPWWGTWWFRGLALFGFLTVVYTLYRYRLAQQTKLLTVRNSIASDLHDEIGSTLSSISISSAVIQNKLQDDSPEVKSLLKQIGTNTDDMMEAMSDIVWAINAKHDRFENAINRMRAFAIEVLEPKNCELHFKTESQIEALKLDMKQRKNLYLIFKEAINNTAKYAEAENVWVELRMMGKNSVQMTIRDDGKGFVTSISPKVSFGGNGQNNMNTRAEEMRGKLSLVSAPGNGTILVLAFGVK